MKTETAMFGAGCFWGVEQTFREVEGVTATAVGFAGGNIADPSYRDVCYKNTGHAEVVRVEYDPNLVTYEKLLDVFWNCHDPTQLNRQGPDIGDQYRSVIFAFSPEQEAAAEDSKERLAASAKYQRPIVTSVEPAPPFYRAEEYHQQYLAKRGMKSCATTIHE